MLLHIKYHGEIVSETVTNYAFGIHNVRKKEQDEKRTITLTTLKLTTTQ